MARNELSFDPVKHEYFYKGKMLPGITKRIGKRLGKTFKGTENVAHVQNACEFGSLLHEEVEMWIKQGEEPVHKDAKFVVNCLKKNYERSEILFASEMLVSDYATVATAIDIVALRKDGTADTFDIKTGNFDREYCSWQLGIANYLLERDGDIKVSRSFVISTKHRTVFKIHPKRIERVKSILYDA